MREGARVLKHLPTGRRIDPFLHTQCIPHTHLLRFKDNRPNLARVEISVQGFSHCQFMTHFSIKHAFLPRDPLRPLPATPPRPERPLKFHCFQFSWMKFHEISREISL